MEIPGIVTEALDAHREVEKKQAALAGTIATWRADAQAHVDAGRYAKAATLHAQADALQTHVQITFDNEKETVARAALVQALSMAEGDALRSVPQTPDLPWRDGNVLFRIRQGIPGFMPSLTGHERYAEQLVDAFVAALTEYKRRRDQWSTYGTGLPFPAWVAAASGFAEELAGIQRGSITCWRAVRTACENPYPGGCPHRWALEASGWQWRTDLGNGGRWVRPGRPHADDAQEAEVTEYRA